MGEEEELVEHTDHTIEPHVIVYGPPGRALAYSTACTWREMVLQVGYCCRRYPSADARGVPAAAHYRGAGQ